MELRVQSQENLLHIYQCNESNCIHEFLNCSIIIQWTAATQVVRQSGDGIGQHMSFNLPFKNKIFFAFL